MTFSIMTLSTMKSSIATLSNISLHSKQSPPFYGAMTFSIMTLSMMTLSITNFGRMTVSSIFLH